MIPPMQYLRMLTNSLIAGALVGAYVALLVLQLNPMVQLGSLPVARLILTWAAFYGIHAAAFFYGLIVLRQLFAVEVRPPGWISLRLLAAFGTMAVCMIALVTWLNLDGFRSVLGPDAAARMTNGALVAVVVRGPVREPRVGADSIAAWPAYRRGCVWARAGGFAGRAAVPARRRRAYPTCSNAGRGAACTGAVELARVHDSPRRGIARGHRADTPAADSRTSAAFSTAAP